MKKLLTGFYISALIFLFSCSNTTTSDNPTDPTKVMSKGMIAQPKPLNRNYGHGKFNRVAVELENGNILIAGGYTYNDMSRQFGLLPTELYDTTTKKWEHLETLPIGTQGQDKIFLLKDGRVFYKYGVTATTSKLEYGHFTFEIFDPKSKKWTEKYNPALWENRAPIQDCTLLPDGKVFIATNKFFYTWDPTTDKYSALTDFEANGYYLRCTTLANGEVLICGGLLNNSNQPTDYCFLWPSKKSSKMLSKKTYHDILTIGNKVYILNEGNDVPNYSAPVTSPYQIYDYETNNWSPITVDIGSKGKSISQGTVLFPSNMGYIVSEGFGGYFQCTFNLNNFKIQEDNRIFEYSIAPIIQHGVSIIKLRNDKVFVLGYDPTGKLDECFIYDSKADYPY